MSKTASPKADALRAMRESQFMTAAPKRKPVDDLRRDVSAVPATKPKKQKSSKRRRST